MISGVREHGGCICLQHQSGGIRCGKEEVVGGITGTLGSFQLKG